MTTLSDLHFNVVMISVLDIEKGYSNDPDDPGGETKFGISKRYHPDEDIKNMTVSRAVEIYKDEYWNKFNIGALDNLELARKVFLTGINIDMRKTLKYLQMSCNLLGGNLDVDGVLGPKTLGWIKVYPHQTALLAAFKYHVVKHYIERSKEKYRAGLFKRTEI